MSPVHSIIAAATANAATNPRDPLDPNFPAAPIAIGEPVGGKPPGTVPEPDGRIEIEGAVPEGTGTMVTEPDGAIG